MHASQHKGDRRGIGPDTIDWELLLRSTSDVLEADKTFYVSGPVTLMSPTFEACVVKYAPTNSARISLYGTPKFLGSAYHPIILSARDDHTVGTAIGTNSLSGYYAQKALNFVTIPPVLEYLRIAHASTGIFVNWTANVIVRHSQFLSCSRALDHEQFTLTLENVLLHKVGNVVRGEALDVRATHLTVDECGQLTTHEVIIALTNSILMHVTNMGSSYWSTNHTVRSTSSAEFQTVGAAAHYLPATSTWRDAGVTNLSGSLLATLRQKTTSAPLLLTNDLTADTLLTPQIEADLGWPDLGYHYDVLHWVVSGRTVTNATLVLTNGVVVATYGSATSGYSYGLNIQRGGKLISESVPTNLNRIVRYNTVQEQANTNWSSSTVAPAVKVGNAATPQPEVRCRLTAWAIPGGNGHHVYATVSGSSAITTPLEFRDCQFGPGAFASERVAAALTNCLLERVALTLEDANKRPARSLYNNLFWRGSLQVEVNDDQTWRIYDNLFDQTAIAGQFDYDINHGYNGYVTNCDRLPPAQTTDVVLTSTNLDYQVGPLGRYYYPTNGGLLSRLIDAGSRKATNAGLYHYTTTTNKEATSTVDIGFHCVAVSNSLPIDTDGEGLWDAFEDRDGDGAWDPTEFNWQNVDTDTNGLSTGQTRSKSTWNRPVSRPINGSQRSPSNRTAQSCSSPGMIAAMTRQIMPSSACTAPSLPCP